MFSHLFACPFFECVWNDIRCELVRKFNRMTVHTILWSVRLALYTHKTIKNITRCRDSMFLSRVQLWRCGWADQLWQHNSRYSFTEQKSNHHASSETSCDITIFAHLHTDENANKAIVLEWWLVWVLWKSKLHAQCKMLLFRVKTVNDGFMKLHYLKGEKEENHLATFWCIVLKANKFTAFSCIVIYCVSAVSVHNRVYWLYGDVKDLE